MINDISLDNLISMTKTFDNDNRLILTLDAGGTHFHFQSYQNGKAIGEFRNLVLTEEIKNSTDVALKAIFDGFQFLLSQFKIKADAISFSFPGPCDYENGVTLNEGNFPSFSEAVALGPYLEKKFNLSLIHI